MPAFVRICRALHISGGVGGCFFFDTRTEVKPIQLADCLQIPPAVEAVQPPMVQIERGPKNIDFIHNLSLILTFQSLGRIWRGVPNSWDLSVSSSAGAIRLGNVALRARYANSGASPVVVNRGLRLR